MKQGQYLRNFQRVRNILRCCWKANGSRGAVSVEYVFSMAIATIIMIGVYVFFEKMSIQVLEQFERWVSTFP